MEISTAMWDRLEAAYNEPPDDCPECGAPEGHPCSCGRAL